MPNEGISKLTSHSGTYTFLHHKMTADGNDKLFLFQIIFQKNSAEEQSIT